MSYENVYNVGHGQNVEEFITASQYPRVWRAEGSTTSIEAVASHTFNSRGQSFRAFDELDSNDVSRAEKLLDNTYKEDENEEEKRHYPENTVFLNVYDIISGNGFLYFAGLGAHHTGIEVYGREFAYGWCTTGSGVYETGPKYSEPHQFREQLVLGETMFTESQVLALVEEFKTDENWSGKLYHIVRRNCNNFSETLARRLLPDAVRAQQVGVVDMYDNGDREDFTMPDGTVVSVPVLMPRWVNRLARRACDLPEGLVDYFFGSQGEEEEQEQEEEQVQEE